MSLTFSEMWPLARQLEARLLEKMKLNCQVFKEEISIVHLNRQVAHLQNALQESKVLLIKLKLLTSFTDYLHYCRIEPTS